MLLKRLRDRWVYGVWYPVKHFKATFLSGVPRELLTAEEYRHSFFVNDIAYRITYVDMFGRTWCVAWGNKKPELPTYTTKNGRRTWINKLGGMSWRKKGRFFVCKYRVS